MNNFIVIVLDGVGIGELPDADRYGDKGSNTLANMAKKLGGLDLPNLRKMGLGNITPIDGIAKTDSPIASFGKMAEFAKGKDSTTGHWEIGGLQVTFEFPYYPNGFPDELITSFMEKTGVKGILGNKAASGTEIIKELGDEHVKTGFPIVYTSADSVFQIAAHEEVIPLERLYEICKITRHEVLVGNDSAGRVIARPFIGESGNYSRTVNRKDYSLDPPGKTILNVLQEEGIKTIAVGKINDLFNKSGIDEAAITKTNEKGILKTIEYIKEAKESLIFTNLVDFDMLYGHRNDPIGFYGALKQFDNYLPEILEAMDETDALVLTADHGNDPTSISTDHSREYVPVVLYRKGVEGSDLGIRDSFADVAQTIAQFFKINNNLSGKSLLKI